MIFEQLNQNACKTYLIKNENDSRVILIDPVIRYFPDYLKLLKENGWKLTHVIDTHTHADHITAAPLLVEALGSEYIMHQNAPAECVTIRVNHGERLDLNGIEIQVLHTPGHTMDSISLIIENKILTGDVLFLDDGGAARDDLPGGDPAAHWDSLQILKNLPENLMVYPAHDYRDRQPSTIGIQKTSNPHLKERSKKEFVEYLEHMNLGPAEWMNDVLKANYECAKDPEAVWIPEDNTACEIKGQTDPEADGMKAPHIGAEELKQKIKSQNDKLLLLDVREPEELHDKLGHVDGIINIPLGLLNGRAGELEPYKDRDIIVICRSGARAEAGAGILKRMGFEHVSVLKDGMIGYRSSGS